MAFQGKTVENRFIGQMLKFIRTSANTSGELLEIETTYLTKSKEPVAHYHPSQEEWFEVMEGELSIKLDGQIEKVNAGGKFHIPKNRVHSMWNDSGNKTVVKWIVKPALRTEEFFENAYGLAQDGKVNKAGMPNIFQSVLFATEFSDEFRVYRPPYFLQKIIFTLTSPISKMLGYKATYDKYSNENMNDHSIQMKNREYKSTALSTFNESKSETNLEIAKEIYSEVNSNYRHLADVRFKLLGLVPAVSIIVWAELLGKIPATDFQSSMIGLLIGILGLRVTYGIRIYDQRNDDLYNDLISRGRKIEEEWDIHTGIFKGRKAGYKRDLFQKKINHGRGLSLIYSSIYIGWGLIILWYGSNLIYPLLQ